MKTLFFKQLPGNPSKARIDCAVLRGIPLDDLRLYFCYERAIIGFRRHIACLDCSHDIHIDMVVTIDNQEDACRKLLPMMSNTLSSAA